MDPAMVCTSSTKRYAQSTGGFLPSGIHVRLQDDAVARLQAFAHALGAPDDGLPGRVGVAERPAGRVVGGSRIFPSDSRINSPIVTSSATFDTPAPSSLSLTSNPLAVATADMPTSMKE
jgi:hypothetical protein